MNTLNCQSINFTYKNAASMKADAKRLMAAFEHGPVCVIRAGYGVSQYAMLNCIRWNPTAQKHYASRIENNGLPTSWLNALNDIFAS